MFEDVSFEIPCEKHKQHLSIIFFYLHKIFKGTVKKEFFYPVHVGAPSRKKNSIIY